MNKLLPTYFLELFKSKFFYITMLICAGLAIILAIVTQEFPESVNLPSDFNMVMDQSNILCLIPCIATLIIPFAGSTTVALLLDAQYNQGVIRNKIISGSRRIEVFICGLTVSCIASIIYFIIYQACIFSVAIFAYGYEFDFKATIISLAVMLLMTTGIGTVLSFVIGNMLRGGKMIVIILAIQYALNISLVVGMFKSDSKILGFIAKIFPQSSVFDFSYYAVPQLGQHAVISVVIIGVLIIFGASYFKKCDIK